MIERVASEAACAAHGAMAVYAAAYAAMGGRRAKLAAVGLGDVRGTSDLSSDCSVAHALLSDDERARLARRYEVK